ncbi:MAG: hypothetical protein CL764_02570 [Chloroflexi bacterium]|nr:hypothetical protein [Chloroflexota bacterium]|tara:strand:- start:1342 stop:1548 length:207 start_codon:yes stop_codon:yes gene_type:complete
MKKLIQNIEDNANLLIGLLIILLLIGIIIEIIFLAVGTDEPQIAGETIAPGSTREQRDSASGEGGLGW